MEVEAKGQASPAAKMEIQQPMTEERSSKSLLSGETLEQVQHERIVRTLLYVKLLHFYCRRNFC